MSKAIQVYDDGKLVDIPEEEVEDVRCMRQVYKLIHQAWESVVNEDKISNPNFLSGVLKWLDKFIEHDLQRDEKTREEAGKIWENVQSKISKAMHEAQDEEDEETAQRKLLDSLKADKSKSKSLTECTETNKLFVDSLMLSLNSKSDKVYKHYMPETSNIIKKWMELAHG